LLPKCHKTQKWFIVPWCVFQLPEPSHPKFDQCIRDPLSGFSTSVHLCYHYESLQNEISTHWRFTNVITTNWRFTNVITTNWRLTIVITGVAARIVAVEVAETAVAFLVALDDVVAAKWNVIFIGFILKMKCKPGQVHLKNYLLIMFFCSIWTWKWIRLSNKGFF
jgi:hypothetical protein